MVVKTRHAVHGGGGAYAASADQGALLPPGVLEEALREEKKDVYDKWIQSEPT
jgi:hypothetical protein